MPNGSIFETIVRRTGQSDFCIFDDRETEMRPKVLIELGVAIGLGKPCFYLNYQRKRTVLPVVQFRTAHLWFVYLPLILF